MHFAKKGNFDGYKAQFDSAVTDGVLEQARALGLEAVRDIGVRWTL